MKKLLALVSARNKEFYRDRSAMIWTFIFPFVVLAGFNYGYSGRQDPILKVMVYPPTTLALPTIQTLKSLPGIEIKTSDEEKSALNTLSHYETDLLIRPAENGQSLIYSINGDSDKGKLSERLLSIAAEKQGDHRPQIESRTIEGKRIRYSDWILPGLLSMNIMFGSMFGVGYVIVRYRKNGVLKRLRATPLSAFLFLLSQVLSRVLLMVVTSVMVIAGAMVLIGFQSQGSWLNLLLFLTVSSAAMISLGLVVAAKIASEEVAEGILNLMTWPMMFLSGIWFSIEGANPWVIWCAKLMPLSHVVSGLRAILIEGAGLWQVMPQMAILSALSMIFLGLGSALFRWR